MSNIHDRWDGAPRMNSKERFAKSHARGYGGSAFRDDDGWYASIEALNSIELELQRNQRNISRSATLSNPFARGSSPWRVSSGSFVLIVLQQGSRGTTSNSKGGVKPKDMRSKIQKHLDSRMRSSIDSFYDKCKWPGSFASQKQLPVAPVQNSATHWDAINVMNSCADYVIFKAGLAARSLKLNPIKILGRAGAVTGLVGFGFSFNEAWKNPTWTNITQAGMGGGIIGIGAMGSIGVLTAPAWGTVATVGTVVLLIWESGETLYEIIEGR